MQLPGNGMQLIALALSNHFFGELYTFFFNILFGSVIDHHPQPNPLRKFGLKLCLHMVKKFFSSSVFLFV